MADPTYAHIALAKLAKIYGSIMGVGFGSQYCVVVSGHQEMEDIMKKSETCESRFEFPYVKDRSYNKTLGKEIQITAISLIFTHELYSNVKELSGTPEINGVQCDGLLSKTCVNLDLDVKRLWNF